MFAAELHDVTIVSEIYVVDIKMICFCGVDKESDVPTRVLEEAIQKIIRIKLQMGDKVSYMTIENQRDI